MKKIGVGMGTIKVDPEPEGVVRRVKNPKEAMALSKQDLNGVIALVRGGTCSFASILLSSGIPGIITLEGAPQSHLGVASREYLIPCVMSFIPEDEALKAKKETEPEAYYEELAQYLDGKKVRLNLSGEHSEGFIKAIVEEL